MLLMQINLVKMDIFTYTYQIGNPKSNYRVADLNNDLIRLIAQRTPITNERKKSTQQ